MKESEPKTAPSNYFSVLNQVMESEAENGQKIMKKQVRQSNLISMKKFERDEKFWNLKIWNINTWHDKANFAFLKLDD